MGIFRSYFSKNTTLIENNLTNNSQNPVTEISYGTLNTQVSRFIFDIDLEPLKERIRQGIINPNRIVKHVLNITNCIRYDEEYLNKYMSDGVTHRASSFELEFFNLNEEWDEGSGYDFIYDQEEYIFAPTGASNWVNAKNNVEWISSGAYGTGSTILGTQQFQKGNENIQIDVTDYINSRLAGFTGSTGMGIKFTNDYEVLETLYREAVSFFARKTHTFFEPHIETVYDDLIEDDRNYFFLDKDNSLYLYANVGSNPSAVTVNFVEIIDYNGQTISTISGSSVENVSLGVYKITVNIDSDIYPDAVLFTDSWNVTVNGKNKVINQEFYLISQDSYFNFDLSNRINFDNYMFNYFGIAQGEKIKDNEIRRIQVDVKQLYPNQNNNIPLDVEYRLYNSQTVRHQFETIPWTKVNRTFKGFEFLLDFSWLVPQDYTIELRLVNGNSFMVKEPLKFSVVSDGITTPSTYSLTTTTTTTLAPITTTTTTLAPAVPNPKIFISFTPVLETGYTNTNISANTGQNYKLYWTTDESKTQITGSTGTSLLHATTIRINISNVQTSFDSIIKYNMDDMPIVNGISGDIDVTLNAGDNEGYTIFITDYVGIPEGSGTYQITINNTPDTTQLFGTVDDSTDPEYIEKTTAGTTYGYDTISSSNITISGEVV